jgi:hypothetical protein
MSSDDYKICPCCNKLKHKKDAFGERKTSLDGYFLNCKICRRYRTIGKKPYTKDGKILYRERETFYLRSITKEEYKQSYKLLENLGYNLNEKIYVQFHRKYGFDIPKCEVDKNFYMSPEDLGMI